jgi:methionine sulfoxide reductase catalytic subunit
MPKQAQITQHFCIQGWSGVAKLGGVPMRHILDLVKPASQARYAVFYSFAEGSDGAAITMFINLHLANHGADVQGETQVMKPMIEAGPQF